MIAPKHEISSERQGILRIQLAHDTMPPQSSKTPKKKTFCHFGTEHKWTGKKTNFMGVLFRRTQTSEDKPNPTSHFKTPNEPRIISKRFPHTTTRHELTYKKKKGVI